MTPKDAFEAGFESNFEDSGMDVSIAHQVSDFVDNNCKVDLDALGNIIEKTVQQFGAVPQDLLLTLIEAYGCSILYKYLSGKNSDDTVERLFNAKLQKDGNNVTS